MKRNSFRLIIFFLALVLFNGIVQGQSVKIRVDHANVREDPSSSATIVAVLNKGEVHLIVDDVPYWYQVKLSDGREAWVAKSLCRIVMEPGAVTDVTPGEPQEDEEEISDNLQPLNDLYSLPTFGTNVSIPGCTAVSLNVNWNTCGAEGISSSGGQAKFWRTNQKKNRIAIECSYFQLTFEDFLDLKSLPGNVRTLPPGDPRAIYIQSLESRPVVVEGYLAMVKKAGKESTNCYSSTRKDLHFELVGNDQGDPKTMRNELIVNEVSPWFGEANTNWTYANLKEYASYEGGYSGSMQRAPTRVRVYGWLFYDDPHSTDGAVGTWRGTAWELHPITRIEVFENGVWVEIL